MKQFLMLLIFSTGVALVHTAEIAYSTPAASIKEAEACFMISSSGNMVNLTSLCGDTSKGTSTNPRVFLAKIKRREGGTPVIDVTFNGKQKFEMLLDTGASQTTITPLMANALGVVPVGTEKAQVASGEVVEFSTGRVASIEVGGAVINDTMVSIAPFPLLGQNFFGGYEVIIRRDVVEFHVH